MKEAFFITKIFKRDNEMWRVKSLLVVKGEHLFLVAVISSFVKRCELFINNIFKTKNRSVGFDD
jgi:hypothetical protein